MRQVRIVAVSLIVMLWGASAWNYATSTPVARNGHVKGGDYAHFYVMARFAAQHRGADLYDMAAQKAEFARALPGVEIPDYLPFLYGPQAALLLLPFGMVSYFPSLMLWWSAAFAVYFVCCRAVWRQQPGLRPHVRDLVLLAFAYPGFWEVFIYGHTTWIALGCLTAFYLAARQGRMVAAGVAIGVLAYKPQLGIAVFVLLVATWNWRAMIAAGGTIVLLQALALLWFGSDVFLAYLAFMRTLPSIATLVEPQPFQLCSLRAFFTTLGVGETASTFAGLALSATVCWWMIVTWKRGPTEVGFAVLLVSTILISPHETVYDLVLLAPALLLLADAHLDGPSGSPVWPLVIAAYLLALSGGIVRVTHVQLASPVLVGLLYFAAKPARAHARLANL